MKFKSRVTLSQYKLPVVLIRKTFAKELPLFLVDTAQELRVFLVDTAQESSLFLLSLAEELPLFYARITINLMPEF